MKRRRLDLSPFVGAMAATARIFQATAVEEESLEYWRDIAQMPSQEAVDAVEAVVSQMPGRSAKIVRSAAFWHVGVFARYFFEEEMSLPFGAHHDTFFQCIPRGERDMHVNILAPRGSGKSTCLGRIYPLHCIFFHDTYKALGMPTDDFILICSYSFMQAKDHIVAIRDKIENDDRFVHLLGTQEWGSTMLRTAHGIRVVPVSFGMSLRGVLKGRYRPTLVLKDDIDATDTVRNPEMREKARTWHDTNLLPAGVPGFTNFISVDTLKHPESLASILRTRPNVQTTHLRAIPTPSDLHHPEHEDLWREWTKLYADMSVSAAVREARATSYFEEHEAQMMSGVEELWPERLSYLQIRKYVVERGYPFVMQEFQNDISSSDEFVFDMARASRFRETPQGLLRSDNVLIKWDSISGATVFLDWAGTRSDTRNNCFACVVAVLWVPQRGHRDAKMSHLAACHAYVFRSWIERGTGMTQYNALLDTYEEVRGLLLSKVTTHVPQFNLVQEGFVDTNGFQQIGALHMFESVLSERAFKDVDLQFLSRAGADEKHTRIRQLQAPFDNQWLHFHEVLPAEFLRQLSLFPTADYDDGPDSLEGACHHKFQIAEAPRVEIRRGSAEARVLQQAAWERRRI